MTTTHRQTLIRRIAALLDPLADFYRQDGAEVPALQEIAGSGMPLPYRTLLVHDNDMTPTLEAYTQQAIHLNPMKMKHSGDAIYRQVVLTTGSDEPIEFGAIRINLQHFAPEPRELIVQARRPLGRILQDFQIPHASRPSGYFQIASDPVTTKAFGLTEVHTLYGRHNILHHGEDVLAEVVEILPPLPSPEDVR